MVSNTYLLTHFQGFTIWVVFGVEWAKLTIGWFGSERDFRSHPNGFCAPSQFIDYESVGEWSQAIANSLKQTCWVLLSIRVEFPKCHFYLAWHFWEIWVEFCVQWRIDRFWLVFGSNSIRTDLRHRKQSPMNPSEVRNTVDALKHSEFCWISIWCAPAYTKGTIGAAIYTKNSM